MSHVFVSYSSQDYEAARLLVNAIQEEGIAVWWDEHIEKGAAYAEVIEGKLTSAGAVIVLWSDSSIRSRWVKAEAQLAWNKNRLVPALIAQVVPPFPFMDQETALMLDWRGERDHDEYRRLLTAVRRVTSAPPNASVLSADDESVLQERRQAITLSEAEPHLELNIESVMLRLEAAAARLVTGHHDEILVRLDNFASDLRGAIRDFPAEQTRLHEFLFYWDSAAQSWLASTKSSEARRLIEEDRRRLRQALAQISGIGPTQTLAGAPMPAWAGDVDAWNPEGCVKRLASDDELQRAEAVDHVAGSDVEHIRLFFSVVEDTSSEPLLEAFWENWPRVRLYYSKAYPILTQLLERIDPEKWRRRLATLHRLQTLESLVDVEANLGGTSTAERLVFLESLLIHPSVSCREFARRELPSSKRWNTILFRGTYMVIVRELVAECCRDCDPDYIKVMFLLLRPRLMEESSATALRESYAVLTHLYEVPLFLEDTFFMKLVELHDSLRNRVRAKPSLAHLEKETEDSFTSFCSRERMRDVDVARMTHVPLPIQRLLAHEGHFLDYFICNYRDLIALETVPHVIRRPDVTEFFRLKRINSRALEKLAGEKVIMREYANKLAFCRNPKALPKQLVEHMAILSLVDRKALSKDRNVSNFAREHAFRLLSRTI